jgi:hypothetical protein
VQSGNRLIEFDLRIELLLQQRPPTGLFAALCLIGPIAGCAVPTVPASNVPTFIGGAIETDTAGRCYGRDVAPAVIATVTAQELDRPAVVAEDGTVTSPAVYRTVTRQQITRERQEVAFETICPPAYTATFVASLQRALAVRGFYGGSVNGVMDTATGRAVQDFQRQSGPDSPLLSLATARSLGLIVLSSEEIDRL